MKQFGIVGYPLSHSFSPPYFNKKFATLKIQANYKAFPITHIQLFPEIIQQEPFLEGLNITIPYKESVLSYLDNCDEVVKKIGACNCIKIQNKKLLGFNTDVIGFEKSLTPLLTELHKNALILGTGGAAKAVAYVLEKKHIAYKFVSRTPKNKQEIAYATLTQKHIEENLLIINTTPLGMNPHTEQCPNIPYTFITNKHICYDLIYNPEKTLFLKKCELQNALIKNGYEMLLIQAEEGWKIWNS